MNKIKILIKTENLKRSQKEVIDQKSTVNKIKKKNLLERLKGRFDQVE